MLFVRSYLPETLIFNLMLNEESAATRTELWQNHGCLKAVVVLMGYDVQRATPVSA